MIADHFLQLPAVAPLSHKGLLARVWPYWIYYVSKRKPHVLLEDNNTIAL